MTTNKSRGSGVIAAETATATTDDDVEEDAGTPQAQPDHVVDEQDGTGTDDVDHTKTQDDTDPEPGGKPQHRWLWRRINWPKTMVFGVLPAMAMVPALCAGYLNWQQSSAHAADVARIESVAAARDSTIALLSYHADTVDQQLGAARNRLTGPFQDSYTSLINDVVIPGAKQKHITAEAKVPAIAAVSATPSHAVVLIDVDQTVTVGCDPPTDTTSSVRVTLDKVGTRWLISAFTPI
jgi:Mce-associated membrane protein